MNSNSQIQRLISDLTRLCGKSDLPEAIALRESPIARSFTPNSVIPEPFKPLANTSQLWVRTNRLDPLLAKHGLAKRLEPEMCFAPLSWRIKAANRYLRIMHYRLSKLLLTGQVAEFWVLALQLMAKSTVLRAVALRKWDLNWHRNYKFGAIKAILSTLHMNILSMKEVIHIVRNYADKVKPDGSRSFRPIGNPAYADRMYLYLLQSFVAMFVSAYISPHQHAYIPGRGVPTAWANLRKWLNLRSYKFIYEFDLKGAFPSVKIVESCKTLHSLGLPFELSSFLERMSLRTIERVDLSPPDQYRLLDEPKFDHTQLIAAATSFANPPSPSAKNVEWATEVQTEPFMEVVKKDSPEGSQAYAMAQFVIQMDANDPSRRTFYENALKMVSDFDTLGEALVETETSREVEYPIMDVATDGFYDVLAAHLQSVSKTPEFQSEPIASGFPQGSGLSPILFNVIFEHAALRHNFQPLDPSIKVLSYADDFLVFSKVDLSDKVWQESDVMKSHGLTFSLEKSRTLKSDGKWLHDKFKYLGITVHTSNDEPLVFEGTPRSGVKLVMDKDLMISKFKFRDFHLARLAKALGYPSPTQILEAWGKGEWPASLIPLEVMQGESGASPSLVRRLAKIMQTELSEANSAPLTAEDKKAAGGNLGSTPFGANEGSPFDRAEKSHLEWKPHKVLLKPAPPGSFLDTRLSGLVINRLHGGHWTPELPSADLSLSSPVKTGGRSWLELKMQTPESPKAPGPELKAQVSYLAEALRAKPTPEVKSQLLSTFLEKVSIYNSTSYATVDLLKNLRKPGSVKIAKGGLKYR